jgi:drug/metabolite transporter (DMT)-like permease
VSSYDKQLVHKQRRWPYLDASAMILIKSSGCGTFDDPYAVACNPFLNGETIETSLSAISKRLPMARARAEFAVKWRRSPGNLRGGIWILIGSLFFAVMVVLIKIAGKTLHVTEILFFRQLTMLLLAAPVIIRYFPASLISARPDLQFIRVSVAFLAMLFGFSSIIHLSLAEATTLNFAKTFFVGILAIIFLGEVVGIRRWGAMLLGFIGVVVIAWPHEGTTLNIYTAAAVISAAAVACVMTLMRTIAQIDKPVTILSYQAIGVGLLMIPPTIWFWQTPTIAELILVIAIGAVSSVGQLCNIQAFKAGEASAIAPLDYVRLIYALIFGFLLFDEWPEPRVLVGAAIIVCAAVYTLHRERIRGQKDETERKARLSAGH